MAVGRKKAPTTTVKPTPVDTIDTARLQDGGGVTLIAARSRTLKTTDIRIANYPGDEEGRSIKVSDGSLIAFGRLLVKLAKKTEG